MRFAQKQLWECVAAELDPYKKVEIIVQIINFYLFLLNTINQ